MAEASPRAPLLEPSGGRGAATSAQTLGNIVVSILGTGSLGLPFAFRVSGWLSASLALAATGLATYYSMLLLVQCRRKLEQEQDDQPQTYGDLGGRAFGATGRCLTELFILISNAGGAIAYLIFIAQNLSSLFPSLALKTSTIILLVLLPLEISLSFVHTLSFLAPLSAFAAACNLFAMAIVIKEDVERLGQFGGSRSAFNGASSLAFAGGVAVFCFDGLGMTLALEGSMGERRRRRFPWVLLQGILGVGIAYIFFGAFGYLAYGDATKEIITLNLLPNTCSAVIVKVGLSTAIAFTFPMTLHPVHEIAEMKLNESGWFQKFCHNSRSKQWLGLQAGRMLVVGALALVATCVPGFAQLISFTGSTVCAFLSFVLPASFHLKIMGTSLSLWQRVLNYIILFLGLVFAGYGTYATI